MTNHDYVIIGAGSAGCVLAARLSEDPTCRVLLLEAGGADRAKEIKIPAAFPKLFKTKHDWNYSTAPESTLANRELFWPRAKMIGGCSSMNAQMYVRGSAADYNLWEDLGNRGWGWDDVEPYFRRAEATLHIEPLRDPNVTTHAFLRAAAEVGIPTLDDVNGPTQEGAAHTRVNQRRGRRWSAADAYLRPAMRRKNLTVLTDVHVTRIVIERGRATGVEYLHAGASARASCREVIASSGAINSPQLLMLSGIGPARDLRAHGVEVVHELDGVGQHLQDHLAFGVIATCREPVTLAAAETLPNLLRFLVLGRGMLTSNVGEACAFVRSQAELAAPDLELIFAPIPFAGHGLGPMHHALTIGVVLQQPKSLGRVELASRDPRVAPRIIANYLSDPDGADLRAMVRGVELARRIFRAPALSRYAGDEEVPGPGRTIEDALRERSETLYHPVGTCRMGSDARAVVDADLRVCGLEGLRVVDASVIPQIIRGHTHAPVVMLAERAADLIRGRIAAGTLPGRRSA
ncbi:MAG: GMC family oxidoreductase N-terminal domain-containing protein [Myxococcales bacterium]|nr:GMC family oxidoreductase N-terminal domain-containing protein [Myxococcales bacterium]